MRPIDNYENPQHFAQGVPTLVTAAAIIVGTIWGFVRFVLQKEMVPMDSYQKFQQFAGGLSSLVTAIAIIVGAIWGYVRFVLQEEKHPHINFTADINFICRQNGFWVVELISVIENKGKVPHKFSEFEFDLNALFSNDNVELNKDFGNQVFFPNEIAKGSWRPKSFDYFFVSPGATSKYSFVTLVPENAVAVILHSWFQYNDRKQSGHAAECTKRLPGDAKAETSDADRQVARVSDHQAVNPSG